MMTRSNTPGMDKKIVWCDERRLAPFRSTAHRRSVGDVPNAGRNWLRRHIFDEPDFVFQVEGDSRWYEQRHCS